MLLFGKEFIIKLQLIKVRMDIQIFNILSD